MSQVPPPHPAALDDAELLKLCRIVPGKASGPGGQHRNKVQTAVEIIHEPTGLTGWASERRERTMNERMALRRLRMALALNVRSERDLVAGPSDMWRSRVREGQIQLNPDHRDAPAMLAEALDVLDAVRLDVKRAAILLSVTPSQLLKLLKIEPAAWQGFNAMRVERRMRPLK